MHLKEQSLISCSYHISFHMNCGCSLLSWPQDYRLLFWLVTNSVWNIADIHGIEKGENSKVFTVFEIYYLEVSCINFVCISLAQASHLAKLDAKGAVRIIFHSKYFCEQTKSTTRRLNDLSQMTQLASDKISKHLKESPLKRSLFILS